MFIKISKDMIQLLPDEDSTVPLLMLDKTGFFVRGNRVEQDDKEATIVYNAFHQWLTWATIKR
jgi:hypothetical protein|tara:strand:+ start:1009 stop:1197 length:189 start_codon:yes stop_codon:yes gene_type:complete